jgi:hypothetical protein
MVRITAGETAVVSHLAHMDMSYTVASERCSPCRLIRIIAPAAGTIHLELGWESSQALQLHLWAGGRRFAGEVNEKRLVIDAAISAGENVVYVGYYNASVIGQSIQFTLATSMSQ